MWIRSSCCCKFDCVGDECEGSVKVRIFYGNSYLYENLRSACFLSILFISFETAAGKFKRTSAGATMLAVDAPPFSVAI